MRSIRPAAGLLAITGLLLLAAGASTATAHDVRYATGSSFGFAENPDAWLGFINQTTGEASCQSGRTVKVFRKRERGRVLIGRDRSGDPFNGDGYWTVEAELRPGNYYATIREKDIGPPGHQHLCRAYRTGLVNYPSGTSH